VNEPGFFSLLSYPNLKVGAGFIYPFSKISTGLQAGEYNYILKFPALAINSSLFNLSSCGSYYLQSFKSDRE
jgi:hypothetical protein